MSREASPQTESVWRRAAALWRRTVAAVRYVLALEPVAVIAVFRAGLVVLTSTGLVISDTVDARGVAIIGAVYALTEVLSTIRQRARVMPAASVVEQAVDGRVVAGPASELADGTDVRAVGSLDEGLYRT